MDDLFKVKKPAVAVDVVLFSIKNNCLMICLTKREEDPYFGKCALPGRFVRYDEKIEDTAKNALKLKAGIDPEKVFLEQLYTFGQNLKRDTRIRTITIVYYGLVRASDIENSKLEWHSVYDLPSIAFDHKDIIEYSITRLRSKITESDFAFQLMPKEFTLTELQKAYEIILNKDLDKRNFRKKLFELNILKDINKIKSDGAHRPAKLYSFKR